MRLAYALANGFYRVSDNSRRQIQQLERRFRPALISYFFRRGFSVPDAEDLVQDVFVKLMKVELDDIVSLDAFVFQVAANVLRDHLRRSKTRGAVLGDFETLQPQNVDNFDPYRRLSSQEQLAAVRHYLNELPEKTRAIFLRARFEGTSIAALASDYGVTPRAIHKHLANALAHLTTRFADPETRH